MLDFLGLIASTINGIGDTAESMITEGGKIFQVMLGVNIAKECITEVSGIFSGAVGIVRTSFSTLSNISIPDINIKELDLTSIHDQINTVMSKLKSSFDAEFVTEPPKFEVIDTTIERPVIKQREPFTIPNLVTPPYLDIADYAIDYLWLFIAIGVLFVAFYIKR